jgi:hypothetical protein
MYDEAIIRRGGAQHFGAYRFQRGDRVEPRKYQVAKLPRLRGRAGTVIAVARADARSFRVTVAWDLPGQVEELQHPASGLMPQRDGRGRPLRARMDQEDRDI